MLCIIRLAMSICLFIHPFVLLQLNILHLSIYDNKQIGAAMEDEGASPQEIPSNEMEGSNQ